MKITVIGTGYLGTTHAVCMAELGFEVLGVDVDDERIRSLSSGVVPFHEPDLGELLVKHLATGRLKFSTSLEEAGSWGDVHFIGVGTPQKPGALGADLSYVEASISALVDKVTKDCLIVGKSTVPVGTARRLRSIIDASDSPFDIGLAWNPEFLREGLAVRDTLSPDRMVFGIERPQDSIRLREVFAQVIGQGAPVIETDFETAELVKVAANAFLATKISFINAFSEITETVGGDIRTLADALGYDPRIGRRFLNAGIGFGGGCLPKDLRALQARASELGLERSMRFLSEMDSINLRRRERTVTLATEMIGNLKGKRVGVLGVAFKPDSDDVRDSPALDIADRLYSGGAEVLIYDPQANANAQSRFPRLGYVASAREAVADADLVLVLTDWQEFKTLKPGHLEPWVRDRRIIDGRQILNSEDWIAQGWDFAAPGLLRDFGWQQD